MSERANTIAFSVSDISNFCISFAIRLKDKSWRAVNSSPLQGADSDIVKFEQQLNACFKTACSHLSAEGVFAFSFHHAKASAWQSVFNALSCIDYVPIELLFVKSELDNGFHSAGGNIKIDAIFLCRRRGECPQTSPIKIALDSISLLNALSNLKSVDIECARYAIGTAMSLINAQEDRSNDLAEASKLMELKGEWNVS